ncbi:hypothetical protein BH23VER1_BH23VER1_18920 [soil metagenome]
MGHHVSVDDLPAGGEKLDLSKLGKVRLILLGVGALGLVASAIYGFAAPTHFAYSWLLGFAYVFTLAVGGLFWVLLHHASNSGWGIALRRIMEQLANMLPWVFLLGLPLFLIPSFQNALWDWMGELRAAGSREGLAHSNPLLYGKYPYLNLDFAFHLAGPLFLPGWLSRSVLYFVLLGFGAFWLRRYSLQQDRTGEVQPTLSARRFSCGWLPVFAICITFAGIDWLMTLDYKWFSTMWGVYIFAGSALSAMSLIVLTAALLKRAGYLGRVVDAEHFHISGKLMFSFVVFWGYITFSQFFLIWYANITEETSYYLIRNTGHWNTGSIIVYLVIHFAIPFLLLLPAWVKRNPKYLAPMAVWILFAHALDLYFIIIPERGPSVAGVATVSGAFFGDILAFLTIGCLFTWAYIGTLAKHSLYPCGDPRLHESLGISN